MWQSLVVYLAGCSALGFGVWCLFCLPAIIRLANESWRWPTKNGKIISSQMVRVERSSQAVVHYRYKVDNRYYNSSKIVWLPKLRRNRTILKTYKTGYAVKVYYNPAKPQMAVLEPGYTMIGLIFYCAISGLFLCMGYAILASEFAQW